MNSFGSNLKKYRKEKGLSQSDVAKKMFVTRQCVYKWENDVTQPDLQSLKKLSELLEVSIDTLVANEEIADDKNQVNRNAIFFIANILISVFCILAFIAIWRFMPQKIPAHWTDGKIDRYGSRNEIFLNFISVLTFLLIDFFVFLSFRKFDGKKATIISHGIIALFQLANLIFIFALYSKYLSNILSFCLCLSADVCMCLSIAIHPKINKTNLIFGVRIAETINSPIVWNKANALACYLFSGYSIALYTVCLLWVNALSLLLFSVYILLCAAVVIYAKRTAKTLEQSTTL